MIRTVDFHCPRNNHQRIAERQRRQALLNASHKAQQLLRSLQAVAAGLPDPPTVEILICGEYKQELASAAGAEMSPEEQQLGTLEHIIEQLGEITQDLAQIATCGEPPGEEQPPPGLGVPGC